MAYLTAGQAGPAIADLNEAIAAAPSALKYFHRAQARLRVDTTEGALEDLGRMEAVMDREGRRQIDQEETFLAVGHRPSPMKRQALKAKQAGKVKMGSRSAPLTHRLLDYAPCRSPGQKPAFGHRSPRPTVRFPAAERPRQADLDRQREGGRAMRSGWVSPR